VLHVESGWVPATTRVDELESAVRTVCEPIFNKPLKEISFGQVLLRLFETARRFDMKVQPQLILLQKTLLNIEGLGRQLYPELDLWKTAKPILSVWMRERVGPKSLLRSFRQHWPDLAEALKVAPVVLQRTILQAYEHDLHIPTESHSVQELREELRASQARLRGLVAGGAALIAGVLWLGLQIEPGLPGGLLALGGAAGLVAALRRTG
jgi:ubiquinone biosynthesis protein